jgi:hypothetical protein
MAMGIAIMAIPIQIKIINKSKSVKRQASNPGLSFNLM